MKKSILSSILIVFTLALLTSCSNNYSNGERIGTVNKMSKKGLIWDSWESHLNLTQTGMTSSTDGFDFSVDNDNEPKGLVATLDSAANNGWKVKIVYHEVAGFNWFRNRGNTDYFVTDVQVLDRNFGKFPFGQNQQVNQTSSGGRVVDTIYVVILPNDPRFKDFVKK